MTRTADEIREEFRRNGISIASWATANKFNSNLVLDVLAGRKKAIRGQSHQIAVKLGLKEGVVTTAQDFDPRARLAA